MICVCVCVFAGFLKEPRGPLCMGVDVLRPEG